MKKSRKRERKGILKNSKRAFSYGKRQRGQGSEACAPFAGKEGQKDYPGGPPDMTRA